MSFSNKKDWFELTGKPLLLLLVVALFLWGVLVFLSVPLWAVLIPIVLAVLIIAGMVKTFIF